MEVTCEGAESHSRGRAGQNGRMKEAPSRLGEYNGHALSNQQAAGCGQTCAQTDKAVSRLKLCIQWRQFKVII